VNTAGLGQAFLNHEPIPGVSFEHNDYVKVVAGPHKGHFGSLVTVLCLQPEPKFILELESGFDVQVLQSELENTGA
jgi:hypothetical protein